MKKLYYLMLMVCTVFAFTACSDDDDDNGDNPPQIPVTEYSVPAQGEIGGPVTIKGKGYTAGSKIFLKDTKTEVEATVTAHTAVDLVFTVPGTLTAGNYTVVLNQAGGKWDLGSIALIAANPVKDFEIVEKSVKAGETVNVKGTGWADDCQIYLLNAESESTDVENFQKTANGIQFTIPASVVAGPYTVMLKQAGDWSLGTIEVVAEGPKKLSVIDYKDSDGDGSKYELFYNAEGKIDSVHCSNDESLDEGWKLSYSDTKITITITGTDGYGASADGTSIFNLENGVVKTSSSTDGNGTVNYTWKMNSKGYLESVVNDDDDDNYAEYTYADNENLSSSKYNDEGMLTNFSFVYEEGRIVENNLAGIDGMAFIFNTFGFPDFVARLLGIAGHVTPNLPSGTKENATPGDELWGDYIITFEKSGDLVSKIDLMDDTDFHYTYTLSYE